VLLLLLIHPLHNVWYDGWYNSITETISEQGCSKLAEYYYQKLNNSCDIINVFNTFLISRVGAQSVYTHNTYKHSVRLFSSEGSSSDLKLFNVFNENGLTTFMFGNPNLLANEELFYAIIRSLSEHPLYRSIDLKVITILGVIKLPIMTISTIFVYL
jgi:hypothetical protein